MNRLLSCGLGAVLLALVSFPAFAGEPEGHLSLTELVEQVKSALLKVEQAAARQQLPSLQQVKLSVHAVQKIDAKGKVSFYIIEVGGGAESAVTSTIDLVLTPPPADSASDSSVDNLGEALAQNIIAAAAAIEEAGEGDPPLIVKQLTATIAFAFTWSAQGGLKISFPPFSVEGGGGLSSSETHTISATYKVSN